MATNVFFRNYDNFNEQNLIDDLVIESIKMYGVDVMYIRRSLGAVDEVLNEDDLPLYDEMFQFEAYVKNVDGFEGEGDFLSKFGLQIRDSITFSVANRTFEKYVTREVVELIRPNEGDLVYFPLNEKMFEIKFVEHEQIFYQTGRLQTYDIRCELFEYSSERFETGNTEIDAIEDRYNLDMGNYQVTLESNTGIMLLEDGDNLIQEYNLNTVDPLANNSIFRSQILTDGILDFTESNPWGDEV